MGQRLRALALALLLALALCACALDWPEAEAPASGAADGDGGLDVHFIDVGQADSILLTCGGRAMLVDGGNAADSSLVVSYLKRQGVERLDYVVCTHAHEDHAGGLSGPLNACAVGQVFAPVTQYDSKAFSDFVKYTQAQGLEITVPRADTVFSLGGAEVTVLGPRRQYEQVNDTSLVLRVDYGATSFLLTGDMERQAEEDLLADGCRLDATVLKVGHHGSDSSTGYVFLREVMPEYAVLSVGAGNAYGHPSETVLSRLRDAGATVYRTDLQGTVAAHSDGETVAFTAEKQLPSTDGEEGGAWDGYIGNVNSRVFHRPDCAGLPAERNQVLFGSREEAVEAGYTPCGRCKP